MFSIKFYTTENGICPVEDFLDELPPKMRVKSLQTMEYLKTFGNDLREPFSKKVEWKNDSLFELRIKQSSNIARIFYFFYVGNQIILTNGFVKKSQKTPRKEIEKAVKFKKDYLERTAGEE